MSAISFAIRDLGRRKFQAFLTIISLAACTASAVFLLPLGGSLGIEITAILGGQAYGFQLLFSRFIAFVIILNLMIGGLIVFFLFSMTMSERTKDIGIMKAFGCLTTSVFAIFTTELSIVVFLGGAFGTIIGIGAYLGICAMVPTLNGYLDFTSTLVLLFGFAFVAHFFGAKSISTAIQMKPAEALSHSHLLGSTTEFTGESLSRFGIIIRVAFRSLMRRALPTRNIYLCLTTILTLITVAVAGSLIASETTANYMERAIGRDVIIIAHKDLVNNYAALLSRFHKPTIPEIVNYLSYQYALPEPLILQLVEISQAWRSERRLLYDTTAYEGYGAIINPDYPGGYQFVGEGRSSQTFVMGVEPSKTVANWLIEGEPLTDNTLDCALIGNNLATQIFTSPLDQEIIISEKNYKIAGVCIDPFNNGNVTYLHLNSLIAHAPITCNLLLLKISPGNHSQTLDRLGTFLATTDFQILELNSNLDTNIDFLQSIWTLIMWLPLLSLISGGICLYVFLTYTISVQQQEFSIMRAIGAKQNTVTKIVFMQALLILLTSTISSGCIGFVLNLLFLIPEPVISVHSVVSFSFLFGATILFLTVLNLYPIWRITRKSITQAGYRSN
ncbi:MAG: ABC transporter permease [Candidatus Bathyarchaeota archaeon]|nr:MAG: ABC transporter permease [Candidatus Bathyarchaeota archaeon]